MLQIRSHSELLLTVSSYFFYFNYNTQLVSESMTNIFAVNKT